MKQELETKYYTHIDYKPFIAILYKMKDKALELKVSCNEQNTEKHISKMTSFGQVCVLFRLFRFNTASVAPHRKRITLLSRYI